MFGLSRKAEAPAVAEVPNLDLSGPRLRRAFENLVKSAEATGGVERYVGALALKASLFEELLGRGKVSQLTEKEFLDLAAFITPVRRRPVRRRSAQDARDPAGATAGDRRP